ncbi:MAG: MOSC domain-containing protein [Nostocaceae cyanobacterium]|nr:MOSC domain-containing protein [Nostocaceae cyanobacterium]
MTNLSKLNAKVHLLRSQFDLEARTVCLQVQDTTAQQLFHLDEERKLLETWLSEFFGFDVTFKQNTVMGFPDDTDSLGPTVISSGTIAEITSWFPGVTVEEMRRRLRANMEIDAVTPFWEDQLFTEEIGDIVPFRVGEVQFHGVNPCQRCVVPTRDSLTGEGYPNFQKTFISKRKETLPAWVGVSRFNHFYRLSVNTRIPASEAGKKVQTGDEIKLSIVEI